MEPAETPSLPGRTPSFSHPDYPSAHFFLAEAHFNKNKSDVQSVADSVLAGLKAIAINRLERDRFISVALGYIGISLLAAFLLTFITLFVVHNSTFFTEIASKLPNPSNDSMRNVPGALVAVSPLAVGGILLFILGLPLMIWPYLKKSGKVVVMIFAIYVIAAPSVTYLMARGVTLQTADTYRALYLLSQNTWDFETKAALESAREANPKNDLLTFAVAHLYKLSHDKDRAIEIYNTLLKKNPKNHEIIINIGNTYFDAREWENAVRMYDESIKVNPQIVEAHYNLSKVYTEMLDNKKSEKAYQDARTIDSKKVDYYNDKEREEGRELRVVDFLITSSDLSKYESAVKTTTTQMAKDMWNQYFGLIPLSLFQLVAIAFMVALAVVAVMWNKSISHQTCATCGAPFRPPVHLSSAPKCNQCVAAQSTRRGVSSAKTDTKRKEIREYGASRNTKASLMDRIFPGVGRVYFEDTLSGFLMISITVLLLIYGAVAIYTGIALDKSSIQVVAKDQAIYLGAVVVYWLIMNTAFMRDYD